MQRLQPCEGSDNWPDAGYGRRTSKRRRAEEQNCLGLALEEGLGQLEEVEGRAEEGAGRQLLVQHMEQLWEGCCLVPYLLPRLCPIM